MGEYETSLPQEAFIEGDNFRSLGKNISAIETNFHDYIISVQEQLGEQDVPFSDEEIHSIRISAALIDALARTRVNNSEELSKLETNQHAFNIFYKAPDSEEWRLQFANSAYLANFGANLSDKIGTSAQVLMKEPYTAETIAGFTKETGYKSKFIEMDNLLPNDDGDKPAYFWHKKQFKHPNGGDIEIRIGMNGTGLSLEQRETLAKIYNFTDTVRTEYHIDAYYTDNSSEYLMIRLRNQISSILKNNSSEDNPLRIQLSWLLLFLEMADDIVKNSPFPLTIVDGEGDIKQISPAYAAMVGYTVDAIMKPGFFHKIYPGIEGDIVNESIKFYSENGYYPEGVSFIVRRGNDFRGLEQECSLPSLRSIELIPSPYSFPGGTIRLNTVRSQESLEDLLK